MLGAMKYRESSVILRLYTKEFGRLSAIAKGVRTPKGRFAPILQPMNHISAVIYKKEHRDLQLLTQCELVRPLGRLSDDLGRMAVGMTVLELISHTTHHEEKNEHLFQLLTDVLRATNDATKNWTLALYFFELKLAAVLGFQPDYTRCAECQCEMDVMEHNAASSGFSIGLEGVLCSSCAASAPTFGKVSAGCVKVLQRLQATDDVEHIMNISLSNDRNADVRTTLREYLKRHVDGLEKMRSEQVFAEIM